MTVELALLSGVTYRGREIPGARLRGLLALLAADPRAGCGTARLVAELWPDEQPEHPTKALQVLVSRARARLGADVVVSTPAGYRLALDDCQVDAAAVVLSAAAAEECARAGEHTTALEHAEAGLALCVGAEDWDSPAGDPVAALRAARVSTYRSLLRTRALALAALGRSGDALEPLARLVRDRPRDEEVIAELLRCEAATVGPAAALARYDAYRRSLRDELGTDPGAALRQVYEELLRADAPVVRHGVRHEPNQLLGRDGDIAAVTALLRTARVVSVVGAGGLGKTRLAHAVGRAAPQRVVHFVPLAAVTEDGDVASEVALALGVVDDPRQRADVITGIVETLGQEPALLVLDNCEHVVRGAADLVSALVSMTRDLRVLTTSRAPLGLSSESVYPLPELDLSTMVELFGQRATAARPGVDLPAAAVGELCAHLDGLPLAVELAAARVRVMSVAEIAARLDDRFAVLRGAARDAPRRHRTLHAVIDWSWHLLEPDGRAAMRTLSVFPDGFTADAARHVLGPDTDAVLERLVDQSLVKVADTASGTRFRMLETVREFSTAHRDAEGETDAVIGRFLAWARDFGFAHHESIMGPHLDTVFPSVRAEQDNLVLALRHAVDRWDGATAVATSAVLSGLWLIESNISRMTASAADIGWMLSRYRPEPGFVEVTRTAAVLAAVCGYLVRAPNAARALVALRRLPSAPPDTLVRATHIVVDAVAASSTTDMAPLRALCDDDEPLLAGMACGALSYVLENREDLPGALRAARDMLAAFQHYEIRWLQAVAHSRIGELCLLIEPGEEAVRHLTAALAAVEELGVRLSANRVRWAMAMANMQRGAFDEAQQWLDSADGTDDDSSGLTMFEVAVRAEITLGRGDVDGGLRLWRLAANRLRTEADPAPVGDLSCLAPWPLEAQAIAVVAHARHGRLDLVQEITDALPATLAALSTPRSTVDRPVVGALLLALAAVDVERGLTDSAARLVALTERFGASRGFQPTMSPAGVRQHVAGPAYDAAVSSYAGLDDAGLLAAVAEALRARDQAASLRNRARAHR